MSTTRDNYQERSIDNATNLELGAQYRLVVDRAFEFADNSLVNQHTEVVKSKPVAIKLEKAPAPEATPAPGTINSIAERAVSSTDINEIRDRLATTIPWEEVKISYDFPEAA